MITSTVALGCLSYAALHSADTLSGLVNFLQHPCWNMMAVGLLTVLVYSRRFGAHQLWQHLLPGNTPRTVKNLAEEGTELFSFFWLSSMRYLRDIHPRKVAA